MATLFLDFEGGNDNHAGTSFATLADGTDGRISSTTFSSAGASFPDDGSLIGQYLSIFNGTIYAVYNITAWVSATSLTIAAISGGTALANQAVDRQYYIGGRWKNITTGATAVRTIPGDTIRIMGSPAPTSLGQNGVWTSQALQAAKTLTAATNATPIAITITGHGYSTGDTVVIASVGGNTAANGTWEITVTDANTFTLDGSAGNGNRTSGGTARLRNNTRVMLASAVTQNIASTGAGRVAWTPVNGNINAVLNTGTKEHGNSDSITIGAGFTTGLAAHYATGTLDLSGYQQVSFWIQQSAGTIGAAGAVDLRLCSDAAGVTAVNTINIPALGGTGRWMPVTVDLGTALGSSIQSIALYVNTDNGAQTFVLSNIIACKASSADDSLTLTSLIGKNTTGETFWGIQSINGTRVMLDANTNQTPSSGFVRGYYGTSETVTTWKRETIKLGPAAAATTALQTIQESGTNGNPITYSGGWDRTAMSTQNLETWLDGVNGNGYGIVNTSLSFVKLLKLAATRLTRGFSFNGTCLGVDLDIVGVSAMSSTGVYIDTCPGAKLVLANAAAAANAIWDGEIFHGHGKQITITNRIDSGGSAYVGRGGIGTVIFGGTIANNSTALAFDTTGAGILLSNVTTIDNTTAINMATNFAPVYLRNCLIGETTEVSGLIASTNLAVFSNKHDQVADNHKIFITGGLISSATDQRKTASGISWKMQPTSTNRHSFFPLTLSLAKVACAANSLVTIKAWMRRSNTGLTMRLVCKGGQIAGVASDVVDSMTAAADTWAEQTITFTPTEVGVVEITAEAFGGTTFSGWVDDLTISQA
jgi:hypothetical protein